MRLVLLLPDLGGGVNSCGMTVINGGKVATMPSSSSSSDSALPSLPPTDTLTGRAVGCFGGLTEGKLGRGLLVDTAMGFGDCTTLRVELALAAIAGCS